MRVPLIRVDSIPEDGAITLELLGQEVLIVKSMGKPQAFLNLCGNLDKDKEQHGRRLLTEWLSPESSVEEKSDGADEPLCPEPQLIPLPTLVEDGMLTYVRGD